MKTDTSLATMSKKDKNIHRPGNNEYKRYKKILA
jgi:hypothetical protein